MLVFLHALLTQYSWYKASFKESEWYQTEGGVYSSSSWSLFMLVAIQNLCLFKVAPFAL